MRLHLPIGPVKLKARRPSLCFEIVSTCGRSCQVRLRGGKGVGLRLVVGTGRERAFLLDELRIAFAEPRVPCDELRPFGFRKGDEKRVVNGVSTIDRHLDRPVPEGGRRDRPRHERFGIVEDFQAAGKGKTPKIPRRASARTFVSTTITYGPLRSMRPPVSP